MTLDETIDVLTVMASYDQRTVGESDVVAWHAALADVDFDDARKAAIAFYREVADRRAMPADIRSRASVYADDRAMNARPDPDEDCGRPGCSCTHTAPCDRGFVDGEGGVSPCPTCAPNRQRRPGERRQDWISRLQHENAAWDRRKSAS